MFFGRSKQDKHNPSNGDLAELVEPTAKKAGSNTFSPGYEINTPGGMELVIERWLKSGGQVDYYAVSVAGDDPPFLLRVAQGELAIARLINEAALLAKLDSAYFLDLRESYKSGEQYFLIHNEPTGRTVDELISEGGVSIESALDITIEVATAAQQVQEHGWVMLGLRPSIIFVGDQIQISDLSFAEQDGSVPASPIHPPGFTPQELVEAQPVGCRTSVFSLGALLYFLYTGTLFGESGTGGNDWAPRCELPGLVQILHRCFGQPDTRFEGIGALIDALAAMEKRISPTYTYSIVSATTVGLEPSRINNEDSSGFLQMNNSSDTDSHSFALACCADGMGGMDAGEAASKATVESMLKSAMEFLHAPIEFESEKMGLLVKDWADKANSVVWEKMQLLNANGGTTLTCACIVDNSMFLAHIGDSRAYLFRPDGLKLISNDHTQVMALVLQGEISLDEIRTHPNRNQVTRALGLDKQLAEYAVDTLQQSIQQPSMELENGDIVILCSDGLWEPVTELEMIRIGGETLPDLQGFANALVDEAVAAGAPDNATVVMLQLIQMPNKGLPDANN